MPSFRNFGQFPCSNRGSGSTSRSIAADRSDVGSFNITVEIQQRPTIIKNAAIFFKRPCTEYQRSMNTTRSCWYQWRFGANARRCLQLCSRRKTLRSTTRGGSGNSTQNSRTFLLTDRQTGVYFLVVTGARGEHSSCFYGTSPKP